MNDLTEEVARLRHYVEKLERRIEALEGDDVDLDVDAWIASNADALKASFKQDDEALARGDYIQGTVEELRARFLLEARSGK